MHLILPGLYVGSMFDAKNQAKLDAHQITHIVSVHDSAKPLDTRRLYLCIQASDTPRQDLKDYFPMVVEFIDEARSKGGNVLVHCFAGVSRSVTLTAAYLIVACDLGWSSALKAIRGVRTTADPNFGFKKQLSFFDLEDAVQQRKRLEAKRESSKVDSSADSILVLTHLAAFEKFETMAGRLAVEQEHEMVETVVKSILEAKKPKQKQSKISDESSTVSENDDS